MVCPNSEGPRAITPVPRGYYGCFGKTWVSRPDVGRCTITSTAGTASDGKAETAYSCFCRNQGDATIMPLTQCDDVLYCPNAAGWWGALSMGPSEMSSYKSAVMPWPAHGKNVEHKANVPAKAEASATEEMGPVDTGLVDYGPGESGFDQDFWNMIASIDVNVTATTLDTAVGLEATDTAPPNPMGATNAMGVQDDAAHKDKATSTSAEDQVFGPGFTGAWPTAQEPRVWWLWSENATTSTLVAPTTTSSKQLDKGDDDDDDGILLSAQLSKLTTKPAAATTTAQVSAPPSARSSTTTSSGKKLDKGDDGIPFSDRLSKLTTQSKKARTASSASTIVV